MKKLIATFILLSIPPFLGLPSREALKIALQEQTTILRNGGILPRNLKDMINGPSK